MNDWTRDQGLMVILIMAILFSAFLAKWDTTSKAYQERDQVKEELQLIRLQFSNWQDLMNNKSIKEIKVKL